MFEALRSLFSDTSLTGKAVAECHTMLDLAWEMFQASIESLRRSDSAEVKLDILDTDKQVNRFERDVRRKVFTHLALSGGDLSTSLAIVSVVVDIERIADYTKNIYELAQQHPARLAGGPMEARMASLETRVAELFQRTARAFKEQNTDACREIMIQYKEALAADCDAIIHDIVGNTVTDLSPGNAAAIVLYVRYLKRIASHLRVIATSVVNPFHRIGYKEKVEE